MHFLKDLRDIGNFDTLNKGAKKIKNNNNVSVSMLGDQLQGPYRKNSAISTVQNPISVHPSLKNTMIASNLNNTAMIVK